MPTVEGSTETLSLEGARFRSHPWLDPLHAELGVVADRQTASDAAITSGTSTLTSATAAFTDDDIGKRVAVSGAALLEEPEISSLATDTTGGSLAAGTYGYRVSATNGYGETTASAEDTIVVPAGTSTNTVTVSWAAVAGARGYKVYGRTSGAELLIATIDDPDTLSYEDTGSVTPSGALPASNTATDTLRGTITARASATSVTISVTADKTVSSAALGWYTNNAAALNAAYAAVEKGGTLLIPNGAVGYLASDLDEWDRDVNVLGMGQRSCLAPDGDADTDGLVISGSHDVRIAGFSVCNNQYACRHAVVLEQLNSCTVDIAVGVPSADWATVISGPLQCPRIAIHSSVNYTFAWPSGMSLTGQVLIKRNSTVPTSPNACSIYADTSGGVKGVRWENGSVSEGTSQLSGTAQGCSDQGLYIEKAVGVHVHDFHTEGNGVKAQFVNCTALHLGPNFIAAGSGAEGKISIENCRSAVLDGIHCDSIDIDADSKYTYRGAIQYGINSGTINDLSATSIDAGLTINAGGGNTTSGRGDADANLFSNGNFEYWPGGDSAAPAGVSFYTASVSHAKCGDGLADTTRHLNRFSDKVTSSDATGFAAATFGPDDGIASIAGRWVTLQAWVYVPTGEPTAYCVLVIDGGSPVVNGPATSIKDQWVPLIMSYLIPADATSAVFAVAPNAAGHIYVADVTVKIGRTAPRTYATPIQGEHVYVNGIKRTAAAAMPSTGSWRAGDYVENTAPAVAGSAGSQYVINGWKRITTGTGNTLNTDWVQDRGLTGS